MAIRINFDAANNPEVPTIILAKKNGDKIGQLNAKSISISDAMNDASEITFKVHKFVDGVKCKYWEQIVDFKLIYCVEWDMWFSITIDLDESTDIQKTIFAVRLGNYELSQIMLYEIEINTENDIARDDYELPTVFYNTQNPEASLLHRIMEKAPHYTVIHVDETIKNIQRTFSFDGTSIYDAFQDISKEINCLFVFNSNSDENGKIQRTISVYDLESNCIDCGYRGEYTDVCPECGGVNIVEGYGEDTTIFITSDELADNIQLTTDSGSVKNCFKLEAGDDLMTATIRNCNPNGTDYIWYISDSMKDDMSKALVDKLNNYDELCEYYRHKYNAVLNDSKVNQYNFLVSKYEERNNTLKRIVAPVTGYSSIMNVYYNIIDFILYLQTSMMPTVTMSNTSALEQSSLLTPKNLSPVAVSNITYLSLATADNAVLSMANVVVDSRYRVKINNSSIVKSSDEYIWTGNFTITNYSDDTDTATSETISIIINDNYSNFVKQKINQSLNKDNTDDLSISGLFLKEYDSFVTSLQLYSLDCLKSFQSSCQSCIDILIEQGIGNRETWDGQTPNLYNDLYTPYVNKLMAIESEMKVRSDEIAMLQGVYDVNHELITYGLQNYIEDEILSIQKYLNFQNYLGNDLWLEFCTYRREDKYSNTNYISDGLDNAELFKKANEFIELAQNEIYKSFELQHSITTSLKNLLTIKKFKPLVNQFKVGNWLRVMVDDKVYKLRLIKYEIDYDNLSNIAVEFSDVVNSNSTISSVQDVISQASSMATSYASVQKQAQQGEKSSAVINEWVNYGLDATNTKIVGDSDYQNQTWDRHGMLFRKFDPISNEYSPIQLKIINSTIAITDDNWVSTKTAIGNFMYYDYQTKQLKSAYGINGEVIVGKLLIGQGLGIYNSSGSLTFDENGFQVANDVNTVTINPNDDSVFNIKNKDGNVLSFDDNGNLIIVGNITASSLTLLDGTEINTSHISGLSNVALSGKYDDLTDKPDLSGYLTSESLDIYIKQDGVVGDKPSQGSTGFTVSKEGLLQASNAIIYGTLYSSVGKIGCWNIGNNSLYNNTSSMDSTAIGTYIGIDGIKQYAGNNAYVTIQNGIVKAVGGDFSNGTINSSVIESSSIFVKNNKNTIAIDPSNNSIFNIKKDNDNVLSFDEDGNLVIVGNIIANSLTLRDGVEIDFSKIDGLDILSDVAFSGKYSDLEDKPDLSKYLKSEDLNMYIQKDGVIGSKPSEGSTGFTVSKNGLLQASNAIIYGTLYSSFGKIGGWTIGGNSLYNGTSDIESTEVGTYIGTDGIRNYKDEDAYVDIKDGIIKAVGGDFLGGKITSSIIEGGSISIGDNFNVDTDGNVIGSSFIISANGQYVPSQYIQLMDTGLLLHTHYIDPNSGMSRDNGNIYLSVNYADTAIYMSDVAIDRDYLANPDNNWKVKIDSMGTIFAMYSVETGRVTTRGISFSDSDGTTKTGIETIDGDSTGIGLQIGASGLLLIGAGESCNTFLNNSDKYSSGSTEQMFIVSDNCVYIYSGMNNGWDNTKKLVFDGNGNFFPEVAKGCTIGTSANRFNNGYFATVYNSSGTITSSDARLKKDFAEIPKPEEFIMSLKPVQYKYVDGTSNRNHWGFIAQEVKESLDNICNIDCGLYIEDVLDDAKSKPLSECTYEEKELGLRYEELIAPMVVMIQKLNAEIQELKNKI